MTLSKYQPVGLGLKSVSNDFVCESGGSRKGNRG